MNVLFFIHIRDTSFCISESSLTCHYFKLNVTVQVSDNVANISEITKKLSKHQARSKQPTDQAADGSVVWLTESTKNRPTGQLIDIRLAN